MKLAEEIIVRAKTDSGEEIKQRTFQKIREKKGGLKKMWARALLATISSHLSSHVHPQSPSKITLKLLQVGTTVNNNK